MDKSAVKIMHEKHGHMVSDMSVLNVDLRGRHPAPFPSYERYVTLSRFDYEDGYTIFEVATGYIKGFGENRTREEESAVWSEDENKMRKHWLEMVKLVSMDIEIAGESYRAN